MHGRALIHGTLLENSQDPLDMAGGPKINNKEYTWISISNIFIPFGLSLNSVHKTSSFNFSIPFPELITLQRDTHS